MRKNDGYHSDYYDKVKKDENIAKKMEQGVFILLVLTIVTIIVLGFLL